jgi:methenyltetrahydromethanopterin cyclohydrolase
MTLNDRAGHVADRMAQLAESLRIATLTTAAGARVIDCGVAAPGGVSAGLELARVCLAGLAEVALVPAPVADLPLPGVQVSTDHPVPACLHSQYAGWQVAVGKYFAMGSGPMRARYGKEPLFDHLGGREEAARAVGVLESRKLPTDEAVAYLCEKLRLPPAALTLLVAPVTSLAGTAQVTARCLETALHKLHELKFDLAQVVSGYGVAPLPPPVADEVRALGRTNDAILYGGRAVVWVNGDDDQLAELGPKVPASASPDYGLPFAELFERAGRDFYKIDPLLFSPAEITFVNVRSGRTHRFGQVAPEVLRRSFGV